jgi:AraC-like DNA-binding protein
MSVGSTGNGNFVSWDGGCLFVSRAHGVVPVHAHYAIQVAFGSEPGVRFRPGDRDEWTAYDGVVIASRQPHAMDASAVPVQRGRVRGAETREGARARPAPGRDRHRRAPRPRDLFAATGRRCSRRGARSAPPRPWRARRSGWCTSSPAASSRRWCPTPASCARSAYVKAHLDRPLALCDEVAGEACLSPSRFRHLFVAETGMGLRPYILWRRFVRVWELLAAGTADLRRRARPPGRRAAHLSRTSRQMFGVPPSALQVSRPLRPDGAGAVPARPTPR